jgi:hypothetical protein
MSRALAIDADGKLVWAGRLGKAKGNHKPGVMNRTEAAFSQYLEMRKAAREIQAWWFESMTFKLAPDLRYTPDFAVWEADDTFTFYEVKGKTTSKREDGTRKAKPFYHGEDGKVKAKVAPRMFPFRFRVAFPDQGGWTEEEL